MNIFLHLLKKSYQISKSYSKIHKKYTNLHTIIQETYKCLTKYMKMYTNFHTSTQETYEFSEQYSKIREKIYKFPYNYSRSIQLFTKIK